MIEHTLDATKRIGVGRTAEIYAWGEGRALRLFRDGASIEYALREMQAFRVAHDAGLPCPAVYPFDDSEDGLVRIGGRIGFVMDRVGGPSMLATLSRRPWLLMRYARRFANLHLMVHSRSVTSLPSQRLRFERVIERIQADVGDDIAAGIREALRQMPDGDSVCHGDFHPDNVLLDPAGPVIIDWGPATSGNPAADIAWTKYLFRHAGAPPDTAWWQRPIILALRHAFFAAYRHAYARGASVDWQEVRAWAPVIAAVRLGDRIAEERDLLLAILRQHFGR